MYVDGDGVGDSVQYLIEGELQMFQKLFKIEIIKEKSIYQEKEVIWNLVHDLKEQQSASDITIENL